ncbi:protein PTCD3 homolog, mitochondrial [Galendromus occidentalis]|uniref:Small ribosomal subunit protein mS39 n=1 Tax=Galendromus occidentalis TaxID=34638 RepID=A0AAJ7WJ05_9ACAR|nr:protein PTCD3 homolog, mitochondrial [Galendromus occidentalis]
MKRILGLGQRCGLPRRRVSQLSTESKSSTAEPEIVIPQRIPRGPTDILRALASTIHKDHTAPHYKFIDDPYLIPVSNPEKRSYALAMESGRKAARYMLTNFPECFKNDPAEPKVELFNPPRAAFQPGAQNSEEDLVRCIDEINVAESLVVYENLKTHGIKISQENLLKLLQMVSFFNETPPDEMLSIESKHLKRKERQPRRNQWKVGGVAEKIFEEIENKDGEAYSALIRGMLKHGNVDRGYKLFEEMLTKNLVPTRHVFNHLIRWVPLLKESHQSRLAFLMELLNRMEECGVRPDLITFNSALSACSRLGHTDRSKIVPELLAEMRFLGIEPSLATYGHILETQCTPKTGPSDALHRVLAEVTQRQWEVRDPDDLFFLVVAMEKVVAYSPDRDLAYQLLDMAELNPHLLFNAYNESLFFQQLFKLLCVTEDFDQLMLVYNRLVPNTYSPEASVVQEILTCMQMQAAHRYLPQLWSDIVLLYHVEREPILKQVLALAASVEVGETEESQKLQQQCAVLAQDMQTRVEAINEERSRVFRMPILLDAEMLSNMLLTYLRADQMAWVSKTLEHLIKNQHLVPGVPSATVLMKLAEKACEKEDKAMALACARYCDEIGHETVVDFIKEKAAENKNFGPDFLTRLERKEAAEDREIE